ncbi:MAG: type II secretion system protein J [Vulcanimicrobiota bacterium]
MNWKGFLSKKGCAGSVGSHGTTLVELMIATFVFGFLTMLLLSIINFGTQSWRNVEARYTVETDVRRAVFDMNKEMRNTNIKTVSTKRSTMLGQPVYWVVFASPSQQMDGVCGYDTDSGAYINKRWVLYYAIQSANHDTRFGTCDTDDPVSSKFYCPHKLLIKKELYSYYDGYPYDGRQCISPNSYESLSSSTVEKYLTPTESRNDESSSTADYVQSARVLAKNVLVFTTNFSDPPSRGDTTIDTPEIQYTLRCFKLFEYKNRVGLSNDLYGTTPSMSVQIDSKVIPMFNEMGTVNAAESE